MRRFIGVLYLVFSLLGLAGHVAAADNGWLVGKWELSHDPDGSEKDWLEFSADGKAFSISPKGSEVPGDYTLNGDSVSIVFSHKGKAIFLRLNRSSDGKKLLAKSSRTGNVSEYRKLTK